MQTEATTLYLGYDASCVDCSEIARSIRREAGDHLEVVSLRSEQMKRWRQDALGDDARWAPTLVRVTDDTVEAWTGWQIAPVLARHLDTRTTWRILAALGGNALSRKATPSGLTRSTFIRGALGSIVGLGVLMKAGPAVAGPPVHTAAAAADPQQVTKLSGARLLDAARSGLGSVDLANVAEARSLVRPGDPAPSTHEALPASALREFSDDTGEISSPEGGLEVFGVEIDRGDGITETSLVYYQHDQQMLVHLRTLNEPFDGVRTSAHRLHIVRGPTLEESTISTVAHSINGAPPLPVPDGDLGTMDHDPCGGCHLSCGPGNPCGERHMMGTCDWNASWQCIFGVVGCATCAGCSVTLVCIACVIASCSTAVAACCPGTTPTCVLCAYPT